MNISKYKINVVMDWYKMMKNVMISIVLIMMVVLVIVILRLVGFAMKKNPVNVF